MLTRAFVGCFVLLSLFFASASSQQPRPKPAVDEPKPVVKAPDAAPVAKPLLNIFNLRDLKAAELANTLKELFAGEKVRIAAHPSTNTIIVMGTIEELDTIRALIARLENAAAEIIKQKAAAKNATN